MRSAYALGGAGVVCVVFGLVTAVFGCGGAQKPPAEAPAPLAGPPGPASPPVADAPRHTPDVQAEEISYEADGVKLKGYIAWDAAKSGPRPGVIVVHEWWGHNDYVRMRARMLAEMGYTALAIDMYGDGKQAEHPADAQKFASEVWSHLPAASARFAAGYEQLAVHPTVDRTRIAAIGYCFGGGVVLHMALTNAVPLVGVATFHGSLKPAAASQPGSVKAKILVMTGDADPFVPAEDVIRFEKEMEAAHADFRVVHYPNARHSFTNPAGTELGKKFELPLVYDAEADAESWAELDAFLADVFAVPEDATSSL